MQDSRAFTLIELLVVVTIIVVLLALLTPALDQAVYKAELTTCGANLKGVGNAVIGYATHQKRYYPGRQLAENRAMNIGGGGFDFRPQIAPYLSLNKNLIDPLCKDVDISIESNDASIYTYSSYWLWFGWNLRTTEQGMRKIGDRLTWTDAGGETYRFPILAGDGQALSVTGFWTQNSHPDRESTYVNDPAFQLVCLTCAGAKLTYSLWVGTDYRRGFSMDCNYLVTDGSVFGLDRLTFDPATATHDERLVEVPERTDDADVNLNNYLPRPTK